ncbi:MAG TPA: zinc ABC transporter substrate-binding protein [Phycisphaerales bacterium]|nr:zinc ABC transporter substrate-binding protein [Phycisphaerales bacterium]HRQ76646.1 zinc ABC transporter substrate-binding protein [Phycisphaerales bacterium]
MRSLWFRLWCNVLTCGLLAVALLWSMGCEGDASAKDQRGEAGARAEMMIVATTAMIGDLVRDIAGERADVHVLMGPGVDPHVYRPTRGDVSLLLRADAVFSNGLHLEGRMDETFERLAVAGKPVFAVAELLPRDYLLIDDNAQGAPDPHVWMDVRGWMRVAEIIVESLSRLDESYAAVYRERGDQLLETLRALDAYAKQSIASIPLSKRVLVTAHDAFSYFSRAYDIEVQAIQGISTDSEAGLRRIEELVELIVTRRIEAIFTESSVSDKNMRALLEGAKSRGHHVHLGGELFSDAMGTPGTYEGTYIGMIDHNVTVITRALGGTVPDHGFSGRLNGKPE